MSRDEPLDGHLDLACPVCGSLRRHEELSTAKLSVVQCAECRHSVAWHSEAAPRSADYHDQYEQGAFIEALRATRLRQARVIASLVREHLQGAAGILDFGCGRGWFLENAREEGFRHVAGVDTSALAVELLRQRGIEALLAPADPGKGFAVERLSFRPDVLTLLDVIEHFSPARLFESLAGIIDALRPELKLVIVKVPVRGGIIYRAASALRALSMSGPIEQLYQVATDPPHRSYFSRRSGEVLLTRCGLQLLEIRADRDFEPATLSSRARMLRSTPRLARMLGSAVALGAEAMGLQDSMIFVARVSTQR